MIKHALSPLALLVLAGGSTACAAQVDAPGAPPPLAQSPQPQDDAAEDAPATRAMTGNTLIEIIRAFDPDARAQAGGAVFTLSDRQVVLVFDTGAGRMRLMTPILPAAALDADALLRIAQANHDSALDARYSVAQDLVWSIFVHALPTLTEDDFLSAIAQVVTAAETFGTTYTSGALVFGGGDSGAIHEDLLEDLKRAQEDRSRI